MAELLRYEYLTLGSREYAFNASTFVSVRDNSPNSLITASSTQEVSFRIVPAPSTLAILGVLALTAQRRSRTIHT